MVRAILDGRKTQTRRVVKPQPDEDGLSRDATIPGNDGDWFDTSERRYVCPYGQPGDRLWVRETWQILYWHEVTLMGYEAEEIPKAKPEREHELLYPEGFCDEAVKYRPSIFMPRWASRIDLEVSFVRVERVQEITEEDAKAEGAQMYVMGHGFITGADLLADPGYRSDRLYRDGFAALWDSINAKRGHGWAANPWVWVVEFRRIKRPPPGNSAPSSRACS